MNALSVFSFQENHPIRVVMVDGKLETLSTKLTVPVVTDK